MTKEQAQILVEAHEVEQLMEDAEERELMEENNPGLSDAYQALLALARGE